MKPELIKVKKNIRINNNLYTLTYFKNIIGKKPKEIFEFFGEDSLVAQMSDLNSNKSFNVFCENVILDGMNNYHFEVYSNFEKNEEVYCRTDFIADILCTPITDEEELIKIINDLITSINSYKAD